MKENLKENLEENRPEMQTVEECPLSHKWVRGVLLLQEKWILFIIYSLLEGPLGFNELSRRARGVNTTTLSQRLELLEREGIVTKRIHSAIPPRTSYTLTEAGCGLKRVIEAIGSWSEEFLVEASAEVSCPGE